MDVSTGTQNILIILICTSIFGKYGCLCSKYVHNMRQSTAVQAIRELSCTFNLDLAKI